MKEKIEWILLVHQLPQKPSKLRVRIWRKLQALGSVPIKNSVYVLPFNDKTHEDLQWLRQEIESSGGEANLFRADSVEGATDNEIVALFRAARDEEYTKLIAELEAVSGSVREQTRGNSLSVGRLAQYEAELVKLRQELDRITATDFFEASLGKKARGAFEKCRVAIRSTAGERNSGHLERKGAGLSTADYQNRQWITRKDPHIDRLSSGWLIRRFIDKRPRFSFVSANEPVANALTFDMPDGNFTHRGEDCTFETMLKSFGLGGDKALGHLAEIVHDIDLKDSKFSRPEAAGVNAVIRGLSEVYPNDSERLKQSFVIFDALYELFDKAARPVRQKRAQKRDG